ncbi:MAG TPA: LuxR C-terminal-related transcriptional regulator [Nitrospirales bacterium]
MAEEHVSPGFLILSSSLNLLYRDEQSWKLCGIINRIQEGKSANGVLPQAVLQVCTQIAGLMRSGNIKNAEDLQIKQVVADRRTEILILAAGLPDAKDADRSEILVLLEEISRPSAPLLRSAKKRFHFTDREVSVVQHLLKGMTNKEIANEMDVTEQTVKEHIKNVMKKTNTLTRTAILLAVSGVLPPAQSENVKTAPRPRRSLER